MHHIVANHLPFLSARCFVEIGAVVASGVKGSTMRAHMRALGWWDRFWLSRTQTFSWRLSSDSERRAALALFVAWLRRQQAVVKTALAAVKKSIDMELGDTSIWNDAPFMGALRKIEPKLLRNLSIAKLKRERDAITPGMLQWLRDTYPADSAPIDQVMTYISALLAVGNGWRVSEYAHTKPDRVSVGDNEPVDMHALQRGDVDVTFADERGDIRTVPISQLPLAVTPDQCECVGFTRYTDKTHSRGEAPRLASFIATNSEWERRAVQDLITFDRRAGRIGPGGADVLFCSRRKKGRELRATIKGVSSLAKEAAAAMGLDPCNFSSHSFKKAAVTWVKTSREGDNGGRLLAAGNHVSASSSIIYQRPAVLGIGSVTLASLDGEVRFDESNVRQSQAHRANRPGDRLVGNRLAASGVTRTVGEGLHLA